jgi:hypothetical protein
MSDEFPHILFLILTSLNFRYAANRIKKGLSHTIVLTLMSSAVYLFALWIPSLLQEAGVIESKLVRLGFLNSPSRLDLNVLTWHWALEVAIISATELVFWKFTSLNDSKLVYSRHLEDKDLTLCLLVLGFIFYLIFPPPPLESRGLSGQGIPVLLRTFLISGTALSIYHRFHKSRLILLLTLIAIILIANGNVRSPLLVFGFAYIAKSFPKLRHINIKIVVIAITFSTLFSFVATTMSSMRANIVRNQGLSATHIISQNLKNPVIGIYGAGLDTLDGYRFSREISEREPGKPLDIFNIVLTFVPKQYWENKPSDFSVEMSAKYLGYRVSGQFLSPIGYLTLIFNSYLIGLIALIVLIIFYSLLSKKYFKSFWNAILLTVAFRFLIGGSSFDIYYGLTLVIPVLVCRFLFNLFINKISQ